MSNATLATCDQCMADDYGQVYLCPLHAAAPRMLEVLRLVMAHWAVDCPTSPDNQVGCQHFICQAQVKARAILRDVEGER